MSLPVAVGPLTQLAVGTGAGPLGARKATLAALLRGP